jgi:hypothetical protein
LTSTEHESFLGPRELEIILERYGCQGSTSLEIWQSMTEFEREGIREEAERRRFRTLERIMADPVIERLANE